MNCSKAQSLMLDYLYGELKPRRRTVLERHLRTCTQCSEEFAAHKTTIATFAKVQPEEPPAGISRRIAALAEEEIEQHKPSRVAYFRRWKPALAAAATAMLVIICFAYYLPQTSKYETTERKAVAMRRAPAGFEESGDSMLAMKDSSAVESEEYLLEHREAGKAMPASGIYHGKKNGVDAYEASTDRIAESVSGAILENQVMRDELPLGGVLPSTRAKSTYSAEPGRERLTLGPDDGELDVDASLPLEPPPAAPEGERIAASSVRSLSEATARQDVPADVKEKAAESPSPEKSARFYQWKNERAQEALAEGNAYYESGDFRGAATSYQKAITLQPGEGLAAEARYRLGRSYQESGSCDKAVIVYKETLEKHPDSPALGDIHIALGECYFELGKMEEALHNFEIVRDRFPAMRELALQKIDMVTSQRTATGQSTEQVPPDSE